MCSTWGGADRGQHSNIHPYKHTTWSSCGKTGVYRHLTHFALTPASIIVKSSYENDFDIGNTGIGWVLNVPSAGYYLIFIVTISPHELRSQYQSGGNGTVTHGILSHNDEWQTLTLTLSGKEEKNGHVSKRYKCIDQLCVRRVHIVKLGRKSLIGHISVNSSVRTMTTHSDLSTTIITRAG